MSDGTLTLYDTSGQRAGSARLENNEVVFPEGFRWTWVMDARHEPYASMERKELLHRAEHARKQYVLVSES